MRFEEWWIANPTRTLSYRRLQERLQRFEGEIAKYERQIKDAERGIAPVKEKSFSDSFGISGLYSAMAMRHFVPAIEEETSPEIQRIEAEIQELARIKKEKQEHQKELDSAVRLANGYLYGFDWDTVSKGYYAARVELLQEINDFNAATHLIEWRNILDQEDDTHSELGVAINQRLCVLGWNDVDTAHSLDDIIDSVVDWMGTNLIDEPIFSLRWASYRWVATMGGAKGTFTRVHALALEAAQRALIAYLDAHWEQLVEECIESEAP